MNKTNDEYIDKTIEYLTDLREKIENKSTLTKEIKILKSRQRLSGGINFEYELGIKSSSGEKGIDDLIITTDSQICCKEAQIERIDYLLMMHEVYISNLKEIERDIIQLRYLVESEPISFREIASKVKYSKSHVKNIHDDAIDKLTYYLFKNERKYA